MKGGDLVLVQRKSWLTHSRHIDLDLKVNMMNSEWRYVPVRLALKERKGHEFKDSLGYVVRPWLKKRRRKGKRKRA